MNEPIDVPGLIRRLRRQCDLSQADLATVLKVNRSTVARWETGQCEPSLSMFWQLVALGRWRMEIVDRHDRPVVPMLSTAVRDDRGRRLPAHLDVYGWGTYLTYLEFRTRERYVPKRVIRDRYREEGRAPTRDDHPTPSGLAAESAAAKHAEGQWIRDAVARRRAAAIARGERDPELGPPSCECLDDCFNVPGCLPECPCCCEGVVTDPERWLGRAS